MQKKVLIDRNELSDNERCYRYILDKIAMNGIRFDIATNCEKWGVIENGFAIFYNQAFSDLCQNGGFSKRSFLSWAAKNGVIQQDGKGNPTKQKKIEGKNSRCVFLKIPDENEENDGFVSADGDIDDIPFQ